MFAPASHATVGEVWHLALPSGTTLVAGEKGLKQPVEWVSSLRAAYPVFGDLGQGYLALASMELARRLGPRFSLANLIQELARVQVAGLVIDEPVNDEQVRMAEAAGVTLLLVPHGTDMRATERDVLRALVDREGQIARREMEVRQVLQRTYSSGGIEAVLQETARIAAGQVTLYDSADVSIHQASVSGAARDAVGATSYPVAVAGRALGRLDVYVAPAHETPLTEIYARHAAEICGIEMLQHLTRRETEERLGAELVEQLLDQGQDEQVVVARLTRLGFRLASNMRHLVVALIGEGLTADVKLAEEAARDLRWIVERDGASALVVRYRESVLLLCAFEASVPERRARGWVREAVATTQARCHVGVSRTVVGVDGLRSGVMQALDAASLGQRITDRSSPYYYEELGLYRLLAGLSHRGELHRFYHETLGLLAAYDSEHNTELVKTLEAFFECNANASQTARALYVHRNTLNYRLQRIIEITGMDLNDAEARLAFQLALKIRRLSL